MSQLHGINCLRGTMWPLVLLAFGGAITGRFSEASQQDLAAMKLHTQFEHGSGAWEFCYQVFVQQHTATTGGSVSSPRCYRLSEPLPVYTPISIPHTGQLSHSAPPAREDGIQLSVILRNRNKLKESELEELMWNIGGVAEYAVYKLNDRLAQHSSFSNYSRLLHLLISSSQILGQNAYAQQSELPDAVPPSPDLLGFGKDVFKKMAKDAYNCGNWKRPGIPKIKDLWKVPVEYSTDLMCHFIGQPMPSTLGVFQPGSVSITDLINLSGQSADSTISIPSELVPGAVSASASRDTYGNVTINLTF